MSEINMEARIHAHIDRLFAGAPIGERVSEVKLEIYMNTVERYHDLVSEGKDADTAFREAISTIGDVGEILQSLGVNGNTAPASASINARDQKKTARNMRRRLLREHLDTVLWMVMLTFYFIISFESQAWYITWLVFLITPALQAVMHAVMDLASAGRPDVVYLPTKEQKSLRESLESAWWLIVTAFYFVVSFMTQAWYVTWVIYLLGAAGNALLSIILMYATKRADQTQGGTL